MFLTVPGARRAVLPLIGAIFGSILASGGRAEANAPLTNSAGRPAMAAISAATSTITGVRQTKVIGYSRRHRPIVAYELGNPSAPFKALVVGSMHGYYERAGEQVVGAIRKAAIGQNLDLWVIPTINPDGDALHQRGNAAGVDLNRNFPYRWTYIAPTAGTFDSHYSGPSPLSEPESRAMYNFLNGLKPNRVVSIHQPLDAVDMTDGGARDIPFRDALARNLSLPESPLVCWGVCHGSMTGWLTHTQRGAAITVEFPQNPSSSYLTGTAARGILAALAVGVKPYVPPTVRGAANSFAASSAGLRTWGWAYDPARPTSSSSVVLTVDGATARVITANLAQPEVNSTYRITGRHGFWTNLVLPKGRHTICLTAQAAAGTGSTRKNLVSCRAITVPQPLMQGTATLGPVGRGGALRVTGWALDPQHPSATAKVRVLVDGRTALTTTTSTVRADVDATFHTTGRHGIDLTVTLTPGRHTVQILGLGWSTVVGNANIAQASVVVPAT